MNMKKTLVFAVIAATAIAITLSCGGGGSPKKLIRQGLYRCSERLETAIGQIERRGFNNAVRIFEEIKFQCGGSPLMDTVYFYAGIAHLRLKQYEDARLEFETLAREHPRSPFTEEARFRLAQMRYIRSLPSFRDQTETKEAMRLLNDYIEAFPQGTFADSARTLFMSGLNKLAEKDFNNARFYRRQRQHEAALIYYSSILAEFPESKFAPESIVGMVEMMAALGRTQEAAEIIEELEPAAFEEGLRGRIEAVRQRL
jgi:outer membrane protein assembly factor BamD